MKKILTLALMLVMVLSLVSCKKDKNDDGGNTNQNNNNNNEQTGTEDILVSDFVIPTEAKVYLTTVGQSDLTTVQNILKKAGVALEVKDEDGKIEHEGVKVDKLLNASAVEKDSYVFLITGDSNKGLGSAGTDIIKEKERAQAFANAAKAGDLKLIVLHVGGAARRGEHIDPIIDIVGVEAELIMIVTEGNNDGKFTSLAKTAGAKLYTYSRAAAMKDSFAAIFGL